MGYAWAYAVASECVDDADDLEPIIPENGRAADERRRVVGPEHPLAADGGRWNHEPPRLKRRR